MRWWCPHGTLPSSLDSFSPFFLHGCVMANPLCTDRPYAVTLPTSPSYMSKLGLYSTPAGSLALPFHTVKWQLCTLPSWDGVEWLLLALLHCACHHACARRYPRDTRCRSLAVIKVNLGIYSVHHHCCVISGCRRGWRKKKMADMASTKHRHAVSDEKEDTMHRAEN